MNADHHESPPGARGAPGWAAARFDRDGPVRVFYSGHANLEERTPVTEELTFRWFSVTKLVTALAIATLVDRGSLRLEDPVDRHLPWFRPLPPGARVTIAQLLSHRAGLPDPLALGWVHPPGAPRRSPHELARATFDRHRRLGVPRYTNLGYLVLGELVGSVAGAPFATYTSRVVLEPAKIGAHFGPAMVVGHEPLRSARAAAMALAFVPRTPRLVRYVADGWVGLTPFELEGEAYGGLTGTLGDLVRLGRLHLGEGSIDGAHVVSRQLARSMREPRGEHGLGCAIYGGGWIGHAGEAGGFRAELRVHVGRGIGVAVLASSGVANVAEVASRLTA